MTELSLEQLRVLADATRVVEAAPGSGKTRALVARYLDRASSSEAGVALLSFTNAAVDEARKRCASHSVLLKAPHFVGTIDAFLHRYIVTPAEVVRLQRSPTYLSSWDDLPDSNNRARVSGVGGAGISLNAFHFDGSGTPHLDPAHLRWDERAYYTQVANAGLTTNLVNRGRSMINGYRSAGIYDAGAARVKALDVLRSDIGATVLKRIAHRFRDVMVDEGQDCDLTEFAILDALASKGVAVVVVADPDQAVFEFRGGDPDLFAQYSAKHELDARVTLATNFRSTARICETVSALRAATDTAIVPCEDADEGLPVYVLSGSPARQGTAFRELLLENTLDEVNAIVLAHARTDALAASGGELPSGTSTALGNRLAAACAGLRIGVGTANDRLRAVKEVESVLLNLLEWPPNLVNRSRTDKLNDLDRDAEWLRRAAGSLASAVAAVTDRDGFGQVARSTTQDMLTGLTRPLVNLSQNLKKPTEEVWSKCVGLVAQSSARLASETIHGAKGKEYESVLLALPDHLRKVDGRDVLDDIEAGSNTEARRVLYVGASRAQALLALGAGPNSNRIAALLSERGATVELR